VYLSKALTALVTPPAVTVISTVVPAVPGGLRAEMPVLKPTKKHCPNTEGEHGESAVVPMCTAVAPLKPLPAIWRLVPPAAGP
jgi:hypothetical protein